MILMKKAIYAIGARGVIRYGIGQFFAALLASRIFFPPLRTGLLSILGSKIGRNVIIHPCSFFNIYRKGFRALQFGDECFIGDECLFDLAESIILESKVTLAERVVLITHTNVGYASHPLQQHIKSDQKPILIKEGAFIGSSSTILPGVIIGKCAVVAAGSLIKDNVPDYTVVAGVPAKTIKILNENS